MRLIWLLIALLTTRAYAVEAELVQRLVSGDNAERLRIIGDISAKGDVSVLALLQALNDGTLHTTADGRIVVISDDGQAVDALSGQRVSPAPVGAEKVTINNRVRRQLDAALASLKLFAPQREVRLVAARELSENASDDLVPLLDKAIKTEQDAEIGTALRLARASISLRSSDAKARLDAIAVLSQASGRSVKTKLEALLGKNSDDSFIEPNEDVRHAARMALLDIDAKLRRVEMVGHAFSGLSLGSVLLLAALGLAITFGLMGIINMAHGELLMIGAYATYVVQNLFQQYLPHALDWYLLAALPAGFLVAALVGMAMERGVIRYLYGRPLETLLATWGISLGLIQIVRHVFGSQNVEVANPSWMSGGITVLGSLVLPYNRIVIIAFAAVVVAAVWLMMNRTRLGLWVRAVTQNRTMADCVGVPTARIDTLTFGLGCGIAGLGGVALSQVGNVGPELGQSYIVDSFMVVVLGGVGQLAGTIIAAIGLGEINKFLEPFAGAVLGKILVLILIILFIQKRPQGLFALKGRSAEALA